MEQLHIYDEKIPLVLEKSKGRRISLRFKSSSNSLVVSTPNGKLTPEAQAFLASKKKWVVRNFRRLSHMQELRNAFWEKLQYGIVPFLGTDHTVLIHRAKGYSVQVEEQKLLFGKRGGDSPELTPAELKKMLRLLAKEYLIPLTESWAHQTNSQYKRVFIKDHKSKWGSCSTQRNINLNWHLILLPPDLIDYLVVHELMHLREMNHSPAYWKWVAHYYPGFKEAQERLHQFDWVIGILDSWPEGLSPRP